MLNLDMHDGIAVIRMDDGKANAFSNAMFDAIEPALDRAEAEAGATVLMGRNGVFSGGFDLKVVGGSDPVARDALVARGARLCHRLYNYGKPLLSAATGHGIALGGMVLLASDTRLGAAGPFKYGLNETAIGMHLPGPMLAMISDRLPKAKLTEAVIQSRIYDPSGAVEAGFLDGVVEADALETAILAAAKQLAELPSAAYARMKRDVRASALQGMLDTMPA